MHATNVWALLLPLFYAFVHYDRGTEASENEVLQAIEVGVANMLAARDETPGCVLTDGLCLGEADLSNYEAIKSLHRLLDDDQSGEIDMNESVDFLMEELTITDGFNSRQKNLHHNSDSYISVQDLWHMWKRSTVHNWTVDETVHWMVETVGLPQYADAFVTHGINGSFLPRLTMNKSNFLGSVLGIKGLSHRTKVTVKAMDAVLFGPPKGSRLKDVLIACLVTVILLGLGYIIHRKQEMGKYHSMLISQIEELQMEEAKYRQHLLKDKEKTEEEAHDTRAKSTLSSDHPDSGISGGDMGSVSDVSGNDQQHDNDYDTVTTTSAALPNQDNDHDFDYDSNAGSATPPSINDALDRASLAHWLRITYQKEKSVLDNKRKQAQAEIVKASEICNKLRAQGKNPLNLFSLMHGKMDNVEKTISMARASMHEVQRDEKERLERWSEIERLLDCNIRRLAEVHSVLGSYSNLLATPAAPTDAGNIAPSFCPPVTPNLRSSIRSQSRLQPTPL